MHEIVQRMALPRSTAARAIRDAQMRLKRNE